MCVSADEQMDADAEAYESSSFDEWGMGTSV
jgi:hypothetical protein